MDILEATPAEIDIEIRRISLALGEVVGRLEQLTYQRTVREHTVTTLRKMDQQRRELIARRGELLVERKPLDTEFERRGGWTRYHYVTNRDGHIHWTRDCRTCVDSTPFWFLAEQSGMSFEELEKLAGEKACTVCFPGAPIDRPAQLTHPEQEEKEQAVAARAAKAAAADAKVLRTPEGKPVYTTEVVYQRGVVKGLTRGSQIKSETTARTHLVDMLVNAKLWGSEEDASPQAQARIKTWDALVAALAHRQGVDITEVAEDIRKRADKKHAAIVRRNKEV